MTQDEVIEMAREAEGIDIESRGWTTWVGTQSTEFLERFAHLVASKEREACALICDEHADNPVYCGDAIRARGEQS